MSLHTIQTERDDVSDIRTSDTAYYRGILHELIDMGTDIARVVRQQVLAQAEQAAPDIEADLAAATNASIAYERITRAIRRNILLAEKLDQPVRAPVAASGGDRQAARRQIIRAVEDSIQWDAGGVDKASLHAELLDRLDGPELDDDIDSRPVSEIIADICRDLGLGVISERHPWKRRTPADIAVLCARAAGVASAVSAGVVLPVDASGVGGDSLGLLGRAGCRGP